MKKTQKRGEIDKSTRVFRDFNTQLPDKIKITSCNDVKKLEFPYIADQKSKMLQLLCKTVWQFLQVLKRKLSYDLTILLPVSYWYNKI